MGQLTLHKKRSKRRRRIAAIHRARSTGGDFQRVPAKLPYAKTNGNQIYLVEDAAIYLWGLCLTRSLHGWRGPIHIHIRHPRINDSTQSRLEILDSNPDGTSNRSEASSPLTHPNIRSQSTLASLPREEPKAKDIPEPLKEPHQILLPFRFGEGAPRGLIDTGGSQVLIDRLMEHFWTIFNAEPTTHGSYASSSSSGVSPQDLDASPQPATSISSTSILNERKREGTPGSGDDGPDNHHKRKRVSTVETARRNFACPYRKHDPHKYNVTEWHTCSSTPFGGIARVKEHLYRRHCIIHCPRCNLIFNTKSEQQTHVSNPTACKKSPEPIIDGITEDVMRQLRKRHPGQSQESRWVEIWKLLFPSVPAPSPYFEPPTIKSNDRELEDYEAYLRLELPRVFRSAVETAVNGALQPNEENLRAQLLSLIRDAQDEVFSQYRAAHPQPEPLPSSPSHYTNSLGTRQTNDLSIGAPSSQGPTNHIVSDSPSDLEIDSVDFENWTFDCWTSEYADSGYGSVSPSDLPSVLHEHTDEELVVGKWHIPWGCGPGDIQDVIYPRYCAVRAVQPSFDIERPRAPVLPETASILDRVMKDFWKNIFNPEWLHSFRAHGHSSTPKRGGKGNKTSESSNCNKRGGKRRRRSASDDEEEAEEGRLNEVVLDPEDVEDPDLDLGFACPYRKHSPDKYNVTNWAPCVLTSRPTIARIKTHLFEQHFIYQCQRCNGIYDTQQLLDNHINAAQACDYIESPQGGIHGINRSLKDLISSRKRLFPGQTERNKWEHIYQLIFPGELLPISPYWDDPSIQERLFVDRYNEHLIRELPQAVRRDLERLFGNVMNPSERVITEQALSLLPAALAMVWHNFRGTFDPNPNRDDIFTPPSARTSTSTIEPSVLGIIQEDSTTATNIQPAAIPIQAQPTPAAPRRTSNIIFSSDSGYWSSGSNLGDINGTRDVEDNNDECNVSRQPTIPVNRSEAENLFSPPNQQWQAPGNSPGPDTQDGSPVSPQMELLPATHSSQASLQSGQVLPEIPSQPPDDFMGQDPIQETTDWKPVNEVPVDLDSVDLDSFDWDALMASSAR
ncbi:hypothetical protein IFR05_012437 [Cadophora sp. M221]|nr:hypothetical protein IFR05_012437 [Cadophora sp. M221]